MELRQLPSTIEYKNYRNHSRVLIIVLRSSETLLLNSCGAGLDQRLIVHENSQRTRDIMSPQIGMQNINIREEHAGKVFRSPRNKKRYPFPTVALVLPPLYHTSHGVCDRVTPPLKVTCSKTLPITYLPSTNFPASNPAPVYLPSDHYHNLPRETGQC